MSTSLLYHACDVRGYTLTKTEFDGGMILFHVEPQPQQCRCSCCGSLDVIRRGSHNRWIRNAPFGTHLTWIIVDLPRVECRECQAVRQIEIGFAEPRRGYSKALARYILDLAPHMTIKDIADHLTLGWDTVRRSSKPTWPGIMPGRRWRKCGNWPSTRLPSATATATSRSCWT